MARFAVRGFADGEKVFEESMEVNHGAELCELMRKHVERIVAQPNHMIEVEYLDEPDPLKRFFRLGSDPRGMINPIAVELEKR
jgi:hypothetical protein